MGGWRSLNIRALEIDGEPWFVAKDVCDGFGLEGFTSKLTQRLDADETRLVARVRG